jgi:DNA adenine methylase
MQISFWDMTPLPPQKSTPSPSKKKSKKKKLIAISYYGGKFSHLNWLLPRLSVQKVKHYCEPFCGSAAVLLNRTPAPIETINDIDGNVTNFFQVLRDHGAELIRRLELTPYARDELAAAIDNPAIKNPTQDPVEKARMFFVRARQSFLANANSASKGRWASVITTSCAGMSGSVSKWLSAINGLDTITTRLRSVQIENLPAQKLIEKYDTPKTLFYVDPPYVTQARQDKKVYAHEMTDEDHITLAHTLTQCQGMVALSGYHNDLYQDLYRTWHLFTKNTRANGRSRTPRQECLWTNYPPGENGNRFPPKTTKEIP